MESPAVPIDFDQDMVQIENNLYLGNLETACNGQHLKKFKIQKVLSLLNSQINDKHKVIGIQYKYINVWDTETEDIISYFPECFEFIYSAQLKDENVLVNCRAGRSRSATIVISFLMKKYGYNSEQTISAVTKLRNVVNPNPGFRNQLKLWHKMNLVLLGSDAEYRLVMLSGLKNRILVIIELSRREKWTTLVEAIKSAFLCYLQKVVNAENNIKSFDKGIAYICKNCSNVLYYEMNILKNSDTTSSCQTFYIEPQKWILDEILSKLNGLEDLIQGNLICVNCKDILGSFDWRTAYTCECEAHKGLSYYLNIKLFGN